MTLNEVRKKYLDFFKERGHAVIPSSPLVPQNDPTTLFTGSGMQPLIPYLLGKPHPEGRRLVDSQKSFRSQDIEEVGDNRHTTFFEMLGNWSLGDYFKREQLPWFFEFLTEEIGLKAENLYVTVFSGGYGIDKDAESIEIWTKLFEEKGVPAKYAEMKTEEEGARRGMKEGERIFGYQDKNWWSRAGAPSKMPAGEPGGPDSEVFYDFGTLHDPKFGKHCHPNCDCGRFLEIGNSVFMQYIKNPDGSFSELPQKNVDFGGGLERITAAAHNSPDIFPTAHGSIISYLEKMSGKRYIDDTYAFRVIADHMKAAVFLIEDGVLPSNTDQGYFVRRLIRRSVRYANKLGISERSFANIVKPIAEAYQDGYPGILNRVSEIESVVDEEEEKFRKTLLHGLKEFEKQADGGRVDAFLLYSSYGFPLELTLELAAENKLNVDVTHYHQEMQKHKDESRTGAAQKFAGGLADHAEQTVRYHTAHHLLLKALQKVLGPEVHQRGSNITSERLRIDFSYPEKMTSEQKEGVEKIVNEQIKAELPVIRSVMKKEEAEKLGAEHEFGATYPEQVSVYSVGPKNATEEDPRLSEAFSLEFCGGPHVSNTKELGEGGKKFKISKEEASSAGVRRIKATLE